MSIRTTLIAAPLFALTLAASAVAFPPSRMPLAAAGCFWLAQSSVTFFTSPVSIS